MKMSINWHENNLKNSKISLQNMIGDFERQNKYYLIQINKIKESNVLLEEQIIEAKRQNKDGFDDEKYLIKRSK